MSFVKLENLNDFIQPGSTCVKPNDKKSGLVAKVEDINLSDCLACSGCITTAETVLVQQQNHEELFKVINDSKSSKDKREIVVSLSLQSIASLANKFAISAQDAAERIASFFVSIGCDKVYDINLARHIALVETYKEFKDYKLANPDSPIINSVCPGWVCYVEKTNGHLVIPHLSKVRSPQQIMGALLKKYYQTRHAKEKSQVYHITLMPCFDKKLEASRQEIRDVDFVLTPIELEEILNEEDVSLVDFEPRKLDVLFDDVSPFNEPLSSHFGSTSGGYAENLLLAELSEKANHKSNDELGRYIEHIALKNSDFIEISVQAAKLSAKGDEDINVCRYAIVNGFRNIQTVVQRLKRKALKYDFIEIMACPSGCINGGAQCRPNSGQDSGATIAETKKVYSQIPCVPLNIKESDIILERLSKVLDIDAAQYKELLYTEFHPVPKLQNLTVNW